jgi:hypothetical protein
MPGKYSVRNDTHCPAYGAAIACLLLASAVAADAPDVVATSAARVSNDFPTLARVEYVQECINRTGGNPNHLYQCACVVDRIADVMRYEEFVEASTYAKYSTLPGEGGGIFRDTESAKEKAKLYRAVEARAFGACNLKAP